MLNSYSRYLDNLLPLKQLVITCRFTEKTILPCFHQTVFPAYLYTLLDCLPPEQAKTRCRFIFPESGRTHYDVGNLYTFAVVLFGKNSDDLGKQLLQKLAIGIDTYDNRTLHNNLAIVELADGFTGEVIDNVGQLSAWQRGDLDRQRQDLQGIEDFRLWIDSGILFKKSLQSSTDLTTKRLLQQLLLAVIYANDNDSVPMAEKTQSAIKLAEQLNDKLLCPPRLLTANHLFFVNKTYANRSGKYKHLSGYHGTIDFYLPKDFPHRDIYIDLLLMGQYLGLGKRTNYGVGQYRLSANNVGQKYFPARGQSLLDYVLDIEQLTRFPEYAELSDTQKQAVLGVRDEILERRYSPAPLQTFQHTQVRLNGKQKTRTLAVAPLSERLVQKLVAKNLSRILDTAQHSASYGYRPKRSRKQAVNRIQRHIKFGRNWILESDIDDCFDSIGFDVVKTRLLCLLGDAELVQFILDCLSAPTVDDTATPRYKGIPQGCPLSPLITNIVLTDLDYDLSQQGFKHIRFADDFVVCGETRDHVEKALAACKQSLTEHGLLLNEEKTQITQAAENFVFLGYQVDDQTATDLSRLDKVKAPKNPLEPHVIQQSGVAPISRRGQTLYVCKQKHAQLTLSGNHLVITGDDKIERTPLAHIRLIILLGGHHITTPLAQHCLRNGIDIHYLNHVGKYLGALNSIAHTNQYKTELWLRQEAFLTDEANRLKLAKAIITARLYNMRKTLVNYQHKRLNILDSKLRQIADTKDLHELRGYEGLATRFYYLQMNVLLKNTEFCFENRNRRPPKDPFNVLLSLGYTILYNYLNSFLLTLNLNPDRGFYHYTQSNSIALCSDLIEPFRHWIERAAITVIRRKQIQPKHFYYHNQGCCLTAVGRKIYLRHLAQMLESSSKHGNVFKKRNIEKLYAQAVSFKKHLQHPDLVDFEPYQE